MSPPQLTGYIMQQPKVTFSNYVIVRPFGYTFLINLPLNMKMREVLGTMIWAQYREAIVPNTSSFLYLVVV